jgi:hypothetical protein
MSSVDSKSGVLPADSSLINPDFIRRLLEQRVQHKQEVTFHLAEAEKHGAADEALASMIQAAEKIVAIMFPAAPKAADAPHQAKADAPQQAKTEGVSGSPTWTEPTLTVVAKAAEPLTDNAAPTTDGPGVVTSDDRTETSGNVWRTKFLRSGT